MPQLVNTSIDINGKSIKQFSSLHISQGIFEHHTIRLVCPSEAIDSPKAHLFDKSKDFLGSTIKIKIEAEGGTESLDFFGIITGVEAERFSGHAGNIIFNGYSPTIIMDNVPDCQTWQNVDIENIALGAAANFSMDLLKTDIAPSYKDDFNYKVQYMETTWQFLYRLSARYGEWFFYDGQKLVLGPPKGKNTKLIYGNNLHQFNLGLHTRQTLFQTSARDYKNDEMFFSAAGDIKGKDGLNDLGKFVYDKSQDLYSCDSTQWNNQDLTAKKQLDDFVTAKASAQSSKMVYLKGASDNPDIQVGGFVSVEGKNVFSDDKNEQFGDYVVTSVTHQCDGQGNYSNFFEAIPSSVKFPPVTTYPESKCEAQYAIVTDNNDHDSLGRIRVRFYWMDPAQKSNWIRVTTPYAGKEKGIFFMPEIDEEVMVGFEGGDAEKPYIIGCVWNGKAKNSSANGSNSQKIIKTKSGLSITLDDGTGGITVSDKKDNRLSLSGDGYINITGSENIQLYVGGDSMDAALSMNKSGMVGVNCKKDVMIIASKSLFFTGDESAQFGSKQAFYNANGETNESLVSGMKSTLHADIAAKVEGTTTAISGAAKVDVTGAIVNVNA